jgi:hypothetical protein
VRDREPEVRGGERARERRVGVAVEQHDVGFQLREQRVQRDHHPPELRAVGAARDLERVVGRRQPKLLEEDRRELRVVMLPGVDQQLNVPLAQRS